MERSMRKVLFLFILMTSVSLAQEYSFSDSLRADTLYSKQYDVSMLPRSGQRPWQIYIEVYKPVAGTDTISFEAFSKWGTDSKRDSLWSKRRITKGDSLHLSDSILIVNAPFKGTTVLQPTVDRFRIRRNTTGSWSRALYYKVFIRFYE